MAITTPDRGKSNSSVRDAYTIAVPGWARIVMTIAVARVAAALVLYTSGLSPFNFRPIPLWVFALLGATFSLVGLALALGNKNDRRAAWLGGILALVGCPLTIPLVV